MKNRVDFNFKKELQEFGVSKEWNQCFHCGTCTAICPQVEEGFLFPRKPIKYIQAGLKEKVDGCLEPWLCYYCGDCSDTCPRNANPGELMMSLRRYLTYAYSGSKISKKLYTSKVWEYGLVIAYALLILVLFIIFRGDMMFGNTVVELTDDGGVKLNTVFAPMIVIYICIWVLAIPHIAMLLKGILNMHKKVITTNKSLKIPLKLYITEFFSFAWHFFSQWRFKKCANKLYWLFHWLLMTGYFSFFTMLLIFGWWFMTDKIYPWWYPQRLIGYYATFGLFAGIIYFSWERIKKVSQISKYSHLSDWSFLILLFLTTLTGILTHIFRIKGMQVAAYDMYVLHLMVVFAMMMVEIPYSKWAHLAYRPFAIYLANLKKKTQVQIGTKDTLEKTA